MSPIERFPGARKAEIVSPEDVRKAWFNLEPGEQLPDSYHLLNAQSELIQGEHGPLCMSFRNEGGACKATLYSGDEQLEEFHLNSFKEILQEHQVDALRPEDAEVEIGERAKEPDDTPPWDEKEEDDHASATTVSPEATRPTTTKEITKAIVDNDAQRYTRQIDHSISQEQETLTRFIEQFDIRDRLFTTIGKLGSQNSVRIPAVRGHVPNIDLSVASQLEEGATVTAEAYTAMDEEQKQQLIAQRTARKLTIRVQLNGVDGAELASDIIGAHRPLTDSQLRTLAAIISELQKKREDDGDDALETWGVKEVAVEARRFVANPDTFPRYITVPLFSWKRSA